MNDQFDHVYLTLKTSLRNYLRRHVEEGIVEDLLQDIFAKALKSINQHNTPENLTAWLYGIAKTTVADHYRERSKLIMASGDTKLEELPQPDEEELFDELSNCVRHLIEALPAKYRETIYATDIEGKSMKLVAEETGMSVSAIKSRSSRARGKLKELLSNCCKAETIHDLQCGKHSQCND